MSNYDDIIHLPRPKSEKRLPMSLMDRAAQFSPFAALTGYEAVIAETGRLTASRAELDETTIAAINEVLRTVEEHLEEAPVVTAVWFVPDALKSGGAYEKKTGTVKKLDRYEKTLLFEDGTAVPFEALMELVFTQCAFEDCN